jgi:addiction module HigA family antidote
MEDYTQYERIKLIPPGQVLLTEFMEPVNISGNRLAIDLGISPSHIYMLIHGKRPITVDTAIRLATYFKNSVQFWLNLQIAYDIELSERTGKYAKIAATVRPAPEISDMRPAFV